MVDSILPQKLYYRIGEAAQLLEVKAHVIRFWEKEFRTVRPKKSASGQRIYSRKDLERLRVLKQLLYVERYTIEGARKHLRDKGFLTENDGEPQRPELLRQSLLTVRQRLTAALEQLEASRR